MQQIISSAWRLQGRVSVVGQESCFYIFHFEVEEDMAYTITEEPWPVNGALLRMDRWRENIILTNHLLEALHMGTTTRFTLGVPFKYVEKSRQHHGIEIIIMTGLNIGTETWREIFAS